VCENGRFATYPDLELRQMVGGGIKSVEPSGFYCPSVNILKMLRLLKSITY
jgi:hypothetical protein